MQCYFERRCRYLIPSLLQNSSKNLAIGYHSDRIEIYNFEDRKQTLFYQNTSENRDECSVTVLCMKNNLLASLHSGVDVRIWDMETRNLISSFSGNFFHIFFMYVI